MDAGTLQQPQHTLCSHAAETVVLLELAHSGNEHKTRAEACSTELMLLLP